MARLRTYGAQVTVTGDYYADAYAASQHRATETGALIVHAYDQPETVAGQGTVGRELDQQLPGVDTVLVPVGGGGLIGGIAVWFTGHARIVAVEPERIPTLAAALAAGHGVDVHVGGGATALAALTSGAYQPARDERVAVVICGGDTDPADLVPKA